MPVSPIGGNRVGFSFLLGAALSFGRPLLLPILTAMVIGVTLAQIVKRAGRYGISPWITAVVLTLLLIGAIGLAVTLLAAPVAEWIGRAPEFGEIIKQKLYVFDRPLAAWRELQKVLNPSADNAVAVESSEFSLLAPVAAPYASAQIGCSWRH